MTWAESKGTGLGLRRWVTRKGILWSFVSFGIGTTGMQDTGAGIVGRSTSKKRDPSIGNNISLAGLVVQCAAFWMFLMLLTIVVAGICKNKQLVEKIYRKRSLFILISMIKSLLVFLRMLYCLTETSERGFFLVI